MNLFSAEQAFVPPGQKKTGLRRINLDLPLLIGLLALATIGLVVIYSAGHGSQAILMRQEIRLGLAFVVMLVMAQVSPQLLRGWTPCIYSAGIVLLVVVLLFGDSSKGAQRWLDLGIVRFQPSEVMKIATPMMVAWYYTYRPLPPTLLPLLIGALIALLPFLLILKQPDLGTSLLIAMSGLFCLFFAGLSWWVIFGCAGLLAVAAPLFWTFVMHDYQRQRVLTFMNPEQDPLGAGYHIIQSKIAIGSGGIYGKGWMQGTQAQLEFLPEGSTDFIFAVLAEEFGMVGVVGLLVVCFFIIGRSLYIAACAGNTFGRLLAGSLALTFFVFVLVNIGMVCGLLPVVGLPLPLVSYGGTSLVTVMAGFGILMSIHGHRSK